MVWAKEKWVEKGGVLSSSLPKGLLRHETMFFQNLVPVAVYIFIFIYTRPYTYIRWCSHAFYPHSCQAENFQVKQNGWPLGRPQTKKNNISWTWNPIENPIENPMENMGLKPKKKQPTWGRSHGGFSDTTHWCCWDAHRERGEWLEKEMRGFGIGCFQK